MTVLAKMPNVRSVERSGPLYSPARTRAWNRWSTKAALIVFVVGLVVLWLAVSLLLVLEIQ